MKQTFVARLFTLAVCLAGAVEAGAAEKKTVLPKKAFIISGHRAGGRVHAPDNSLPNVLFAIENGFTAMEIDLWLTKDGKLVLWHDYSLPRAYLEPGASGKIAINQLSGEQVGKIRYSEKVGGKKWDDVKIVSADEVVGIAKGKINFHLDTKDVPANTLIEFIRKHDIRHQSMVMSGDIDYLRKIHHAEPEVCLEYADNTLGRRQLNGKWEWYATEKQHDMYAALMKKLATVGVDALCTKGLTKEKVVICHQYGIMVRTSAGNMKPGISPDRYIEMGVDYALTDDPQLMGERVSKLRPGASLSKPGQTFFELIRGD